MLRFGLGSVHTPGTDEEGTLLEISGMAGDLKKKAMEVGISTALFAGERLGESHFQFIKRAGFEFVEVLAGKPHLDVANETQIREVRDVPAYSR